MTCRFAERPGHVKPAGRFSAPGRPVVVIYGQFAEIMRTDCTSSVFEAMAPALPLAAPVEPDVAPVEPEVAPVEPAAPDVAPVAPDVAPVAPDVAPVAPDVAPVAPDVAPVEPELAPADGRLIALALALARPVTATRWPTWLARSDVLPLNRHVAAAELAPADALTPAEPVAAVLPDDPAPLVAPVDPVAPDVPAVAPVVPVAPAPLVAPDAVVPDGVDEGVELPLALADAAGALDCTLVNV